MPPRTLSGPFQPWTLVSLKDPAHSLKISLLQSLLALVLLTLENACSLVKKCISSPASSSSMENSLRVGIQQGVLCMPDFSYQGECVNIMRKLCSHSRSKRSYINIHIR